MKIAGWARRAVANYGLSIRLACSAFAISETCYRYQANHSRMLCGRPGIERYNLTVRYDWLGQYLFDNLEEIQVFATQWQWTYNYERPNMALGGITPMQKVA